MARTLKHDAQQQRMDADAYPTDDYRRTMGEILTLNRIDQGWECDVILAYGMRSSGPHYCGMPEHDPFTNRCYHHGPADSLPGGPI